MIIHGDAMEVLRELAPASFDAIVTDPPYGETSLEWDRWPRGWLALCLSEDGGPRLMRSVIAVRSCHGRASHPTQKPEGIVEPLLRYSVPPGGHVLDPFAGSGTTALVARRLGMRATCIEADAEHVATARHRLASELPLGVAS